jgi:Tfp pilus assembly protein PilO
LEEVRQLKGLSLREKVLLAILLVAALGFGYYRFFLSHMLDTMNETKSSIASLQIQERKIKQAPSVKEKLDNQLKEVTVLYNASLLEIPRQYRNSEIAYQLKALCDANSTVLSSISLGAGTALTVNPTSTPSTEGTNTKGTNTESTNTQGTKTAANGIYMVPVVISITGNYNEIMNLVKAIENDTRTSQVGTIGISSGTKGEGLNASISLVFYYINNGEDAEETYNFNTGTYGKPDLFN